MHISNICKSTANQINALIRLKNFMNFEEKKILMNSYFMRAMCRGNVCGLWLGTNIGVWPATDKKFYVRLTFAKMHAFVVFTEKYL